MTGRRVAGLAAALWLCTAAALAEVAVPPLTAQVTDLTGTLSAEERGALEQSLQAFEREKGSQVVVLLVPTTEPETIEQYSIRVADAWKIGREEPDDGVILIVAKEDRTVRIEVGYGLEGALTDAASKRIIEEAIVPRFRQGDFHGGIVAGVEAITRVIRGEELPASEWESEPGNGGGGSGEPFEAVGYGVFGAVAVGSMLRAVLGRFLAALVVGIVCGAIVAALVSTPIGLIAGLLGFFFTLFGAVGGSGYGRGGGFSSRGGGGGFSGGGGRFGGGGASGRW